MDEQSCESESKEATPEAQENRKELEDPALFCQIDGEPGIEIYRKYMDFLKEGSLRSLAEIDVLFVRTYTLISLQM